MRKLKFRAWDKEYKKMFYVMDLINLAVDGVQMVTCYQHSDRPIGASLENYDIMQFTGLYDSKGKEIYFGDILATSNSDKNYDFWDKEENGYTVVQENQYELGVTYSKWSISYDKNSIYHNRFCEVIGNIYENENLLTK